MPRKLLPIVTLVVLIASVFLGCSGGGAPCPSTLTILSISEGDVSIMKADTSDWVGVQVGTELEEGDSLKTGGNSSAEITFFDGSIMELAADTQIEILALDVVCSTGVTAVSLLQMIGDTISHVTQILDPASSYEIDTPSGTAGVRGSRLRVRVVYFHPVYPDGTALITNLEGNIYAIAQGVQVDVPVDETCILKPGEPPNLMPVARDDEAITNEHTPVIIPVLDNDYDPDDDTVAVDSVTQGNAGYVTIVDDQHVRYGPEPGFNGIDEFTYTISDGKGGTDTAKVTVTVLETSAEIEVTIAEGPSALVFIWDDTRGGWAIDKETELLVDGTNHETPATIKVCGGRDYYVWVDYGGYGYYVYEYPEGWDIKTEPFGEPESAYGYLVADSLASVSFVLG